MLFQYLSSYIAFVVTLVGNLCLLQAWFFFLFILFEKIFTD